MTRKKFDALNEKQKAKACKCNDYKELVRKACTERDKFNNVFDVYTAMYRIHKQAIARPKKPRQRKPLYHPVTTNMLIRAMYDTYIPRDEKLI